MTSGHPIPYNVDEMLAEARRIAGIDIIDDSVREPLSVLLGAFNTDSQLHEAGAKAMSDRTLRLLANRLRMMRDYAAHPEIAEQEVLAPIFVGGLGRTGSTKAQQLLAASGEFNWLSFWRVFNPCLLTGDRNESPQPRIDDAAAYLEWFDRASPETKSAHSFALHDPEEESTLLEHSFLSPVPLGWSPVPSYLRWLSGQDMRAQFEYLRDSLKYLQWQGLATPGKRWVLKSPLYGGMEPFIFDVFPDSALVMTHRRPSECIASGLRLMDLFHKPFTDCPTSVSAFIEGQGGAIAQHLKNRATDDGARMLDVHLRELIMDPVRVIETIFQKAGIAFTDETKTRIIDWEKNDPPHRHGTFRYSLADYGLTAEGVDSHFAEYVAFLDQRFPEIMNRSTKRP